MNQKMKDQLEQWHENDEYDKIIDAIETARERDDEMIGLLARAYNNRGDEGDYDRAVALLQSIEKQGENDPVWHFRMGFAHYYADREEQAAACFERVLELDPTDKDAEEFLESCRSILAGEEDGEEEEGGEYAPELYEEAEVEALDAHVERYFGKYHSVFHEIISPDIHVDILLLQPNEERNHYTLITQGMGAHWMNVPEELAQHKLERAELVICLPPDWDLQDSDDERWYWPLRWLKILARLPGEQDTWLGWGHTVPNGEPVAENTKFSCMMLIGPQEVEEGAGCCPLPDGSEVNFYEVIPLYEEEMNFKLEHGADALLERMGEVSHVVDIARANTCMP